MPPKGKKVGKVHVIEQPPSAETAVLELVEALKSV